MCVRVHAQSLTCPQKTLKLPQIMVLMVLKGDESKKGILFTYK